MLTRSVMAQEVAPRNEVAISVVEIQLSPREYAKKLVTEKWGEDQWVYFDKIISRESRNWTVNTAHYPTGYTADGTKSSAYGLGGFLDRTWGDVGCVKTDDMYEQVRCAILYIEKRPAYGTPQKAWEWHLQNNWY